MLATPPPPPSLQLIGVSESSLAKEVETSSNFTPRDASPQSA